MLYAIVFAVFMTLICVAFLYPRKVVRLQRFAYAEKVFERINHEIAIFNKLKITLPKTRGHADVYIKWLGRLHVNPKILCDRPDPIEKLVYIYAASKLLSTSDEFKRRQLYKNIIVTLGVTKTAKNKLIPYSIKPLRLKNSNGRGVSLYAIRQPLFKFMQTHFVPRSENTRFSHSYITQQTPTAKVKSYVASRSDGGFSDLVECLEITGQYRFERTLAPDKMKSTISHTSDTFFCVNKGRTIAVHVQDTKRLNFETSMAEHTSNLNLYINLKHGGKIFVVTAPTKQQAIQIVASIKQQKGNLDYLQTPEQIAQTAEAESLYATAHNSRFITGEKLYKRMLESIQHVPTIHLPTLVYDITDGEELFAVIDNFDKFKMISRAGVNLNIVVLYSSQNDVVREFITAFTNQADARELVNAGVFLFFIDRIRTDNDVVYYLSKILDAANNSPFTKGGVVIGDGGFSIVSRKNVSYSTTDPRTNITKYHRLAPNHEVLDEFGRVIEIGKDAIVSKITITKKLDAKKKSCYTRKVV